jgi:hypothetical protein
MRTASVNEFSSCKAPIELTGIIYLYSVSGKRDIAEPPSAFVRSRLKELCNLKNIVLATTMWSSRSAQGEMWEAQFKSTDKWRTVLDDGEAPLRFDDSFESAWEIIKTAVEGA